jgi:hypothetical protein
MLKVCGRQGQNWGVTADKKSLWVKNGCKGVFEVTIKDNFSWDNDDDSPIVIPGVNDGQNNNGNNGSTNDRQCNKPKLDNCLKYGGGNGCYTKWCN